MTSYFKTVVDLPLASLLNKEFSHVLFPGNFAKIWVKFFFRKQVSICFWKPNKVSLAFIKDTMQTPV